MGWTKVQAKAASTKGNMPYTVCKNATCLGAIAGKAYACNYEQSWKQNCSWCGTPFAFPGKGEDKAKSKGKGDKGKGKAKGKGKDVDFPAEEDAYAAEPSSATAATAAAAGAGAQTNGNLTTELLLSQLFNRFHLNVDTKDRVTELFNSFPEAVAPPQPPKKDTLSEASEKCDKLVKAINHHQKQIDEGEVAITNLMDQVEIKTKRIQKLREDMSSLAIALKQAKETVAHVVWQPRTQQETSNEFDDFVECCQSHAEIAAATAAEQQRAQEAHESHVQEQRNAETDRILQECFNQDFDQQDQSHTSVSTTLVQTNGCLTSAVAPHTSGPSSNTFALLPAPSGMQHKRAAGPETQPCAHEGGEMADTQALPPPAKAVRTTSSTAQLHTFAGASPAQGGSADGVS